MLTVRVPDARARPALAWIRQVSGDPAGALEAIDEASEASPGLVGPLNPVPAQRARAAHAASQNYPQPTPEARNVPTPARMPTR